MKPFLIVVSFFSLFLQCSKVSASGLGEARELIRKQRWSDALVILKSLETTGQGKSQLVTIEMSRALTFLGRKEEAIRYLIESYERNPRLALERRIRTLSRIFFQQITQETYQEGVRNLDLDPKKSRELFEKALESEPDQVDCLVRLGQMMTLNQEADSAYEKLRYAKSLNPFEPEVLFWLGRSMILRGEIDAATREIKKALEYRPDHEWGSIWYAQALESKGDTFEIEKFLKSQVMKYPDQIHLTHFWIQYRLKQVGSNSELLWNLRQETQEAISRLVRVKSVEKKYTAVYPVTVVSAQVLRKSLLDTLQLIEDQLIQ